LYGFFLGTGVLTRISVATFYQFLLWELLVGDPYLVGPISALFGFLQGAPLLVAGWKVSSCDDAYRIGSRSWSLRPIVHRVNSGILAATSVCCFVAIYPQSAHADFTQENAKMRAYVADTKNSTHGSIEVFDPSTGRHLKTLESKYDPDIAVSPDGKLLFVIESDVEKIRTTSTLLTYNTKTFKLLKRVPLVHRTLYNVRPSFSEIVVSEDGRYLYLLQTETLGNDKAKYSIATYDVAHRKFLPTSTELPEGVLAFGKLRGRSALFAAVQGREIEGVTWGDPATSLKVHEFEHPVQRGHDFTISAAVPDPSGKFLYIVTRNGLLRVADIEKDSVGPEVKLDLPSGSAVPIQHLIVTPKSFVLGVSGKEGAARGQTESVYLFDRSSLKPVSSFKLSPPAEQIELSPDGSKLYASSMLVGSITTYDLSTGKSLSRIEKAGQTPVRFSVAPDP
jgi:WD40 repeat protein